MIRSRKPGRPNLAAGEGKRMDIPKLIEIFIRAGRIANKSQQTLTWYQRRLTQFVDFLRDNDHSLQIVDIMKADGEAYIEFLMNRTARWQHHPYHKPHTDKGLSTFTIHGHVRAIRALTHWAKDEGYLPQDPFENCRFPNCLNGSMRFIPRRILNAS